LHPTMHWILLIVFLAFVGGAPSSNAQSVGTFTAIGNMSVPRSFHTATLLADGKVLIVGGAATTRLGGETQPVTSAELYDPNTGTFTPSASMATPMVFPTATLLNDGRVLVVGRGYPFDACLKNTAELYDPTTGTFSQTGSTVTNQLGGRAILLNDGRVLIAGGASACPRNEPVPIANPELYDPSTDIFTPTGPFATTGSNFYVNGGPDISAVSLLPDGRVLIAGELNSELYDPVTNTFSLTSPMTTLCFGGPTPPLYIAGRTATLLANGKVLLTGGEHEDCGRYASAELYEPLTQKFVAAGEMTRQRDNHAATLLPDGTVLISGGETSNCDSRGCFFAGTTTNVEAYDSFTRAFTVLGNMTARRAGHTVTLLLDGNVLIAGGYGYGGIGIYDGTFASAEIYAPPVPVPAPVVTGLRFDRANVAGGSSYSVDVSGSNLTSETFFDIRFTSPGTNGSDVVLNWQRGVTAGHDVPASTALGIWNINGVRAHQIETDHTGNFFPVSATVTVLP
jgi:Galactose oxidase, central domain